MTGSNIDALNNKSACEHPKCFLPCHLRAFLQFTSLLGLRVKPSRPKLLTALSTWFTLSINVRRNLATGLLSSSVRSIHRFLFRLRLPSGLSPRCRHKLTSSTLRAARRGGHQSQGDDTTQTSACSFRRIHGWAVISGCAAGGCGGGSPVLRPATRGPRRPCLRCLPLLCSPRRGSGGGKGGGGGGG